MNVYSKSTSKKNLTTASSENFDAESIERVAWRRAVASVVFSHLRIVDVAEICGVTWVTASRWKAKGEIPFGRVSAVLHRLRVSMDFIVRENVERY